MSSRSFEGLKARHGPTHPEVAAAMLVMAGSVSNTVKIRLHREVDFAA